MCGTFLISNQVLFRCKLSRAIDEVGFPCNFL